MKRGDAVRADGKVAIVVHIPEEGRRGSIKVRKLRADGRRGPPVKAREIVPIPPEDHPFAVGQDTDDGLRGKFIRKSTR